MCFSNKCKKSQEKPQNLVAKNQKQGTIRPEQALNRHEHLGHKKTLEMDGPCAPEGRRLHHKNRNSAGHVKGKRRRGRGKTAWRRTLEEELTDLGHPQLGHHRATGQIQGEWMNENVYIAHQKLPHKTLSVHSARMVMWRNFLAAPSADMISARDQNETYITVNTFLCRFSPKKQTKQKSKTN